MPWHMSLVLTAKVRRNLSQNEQLWQTPEIGNVLGPTFGFKNNFNSKSKNTENIQSYWSLSSYNGKSCIALDFSRFGAESLNWSVVGASTLIQNSVHTALPIPTRLLRAILKPQSSTRRSVSFCWGRSGQARPSECKFRLKSAWRPGRWQLTLLSMNSIGLLSLAFLFIEINQDIFIRSAMWRNLVLMSSDRLRVLPKWCATRASWLPGPNC